MKSSASVGELPPFPPSPYCVGDTKESDSMQAVGVAKIMMRYCSGSNGVLNKDKLSGLLGMTVKYIAELSPQGSSNQPLHWVICRE